MGIIGYDMRIKEEYWVNFIEVLEGIRIIGKIWLKLNDRIGSIINSTTLFTTLSLCVTLCMG